MAQGFDENFDLKKRIEELNRADYASLEKTIEAVDELRIIRGEIISGSPLQRAIYNFLGQEETNDLEKIVEKLAQLDDKSLIDDKSSVVDEGKIRQLVEEYEQYLEENGLNDQEAIDRISKRNNLSKNEVDAFLKNTRLAWQEKIKIEEKKVENFNEKEEEIKLADIKIEKKEEVKLVEEKIEEIANRSKEVLEGNEKVKEKIVEEIKAIIREDEIKTKSEEIADLAKRVAQELKQENNSEIRIEAKKIVLEIENLKENYSQEIEVFKKSEFEEKFIEESLKLNPEIKPIEIEALKEYGKMVADNVVARSVIDGEKDSALINNSQDFSPGKLENAWVDLKTVNNFLVKDKQEIEIIKSKNIEIKRVIEKINLPTQLKEVRSFENIMAQFKDNRFNQLFNKAQNFLKLGNNISKISGNWTNKALLKGGEKLVSKIGNQAIKEFASNALGVVAKEGFKKGVETVLKGVLGKGVQAVAGKLLGTAAATALSSTGIGALVVAGIAAGKKVLKFFENIANKLGINSKKFFEENFGKVGGAILSTATALISIPLLAIGTITAAAVLPVILLVFGGLFIYQQFIIAPMVSSLVPPKEALVDEIDGSTYDYVIGNFPITIRKERVDNIDFYFFEEENRRESGRINQKYDLAREDHSSLSILESKYTIDPQATLDRRVLPAFYAMFNASRSEIGGNELKLYSGYRSTEEEGFIRKGWEVEIKKNVIAGNYVGKSYYTWNCNDIFRDHLYDSFLTTLEARINFCVNRYSTEATKSPHLTGRALDLVVNTSIGDSWLKANAANYGFYNYSAESWHYEYNPDPSLIKGN